jgi:hypothetical protein
MPIEKFTAGPWLKNENGNVVNRQGFLISLSDHEQILTEQEKAANQQLISAAPDMYYIIRELYQSAKLNGAIYPGLENAYNKALGITS